MIREDGYYWVNADGDWFIAEWSNRNSCWFLAGWVYENDGRFIEIDEDRISRGEE